MAEENKQSNDQQTPNVPNGTPGGKLSLVLTIASVVCAVAAPVLSWFMQPLAVKACKDYEDQLYEEYIKAKETNPNEEWVPLTRGERFRKSAKYMLAPAAVSAIGVACSIGAHAKDQNTINQVVNYANAATVAATVFQQVTAEKVPSQKYDEIRKEVNNRLPESIPQTNKEIKGINDTKAYVDSLDEASRSGKCWIKDPISGQLWWGSITQLDAAINEVNNDLQCGDGYVTHAEYMIYCQSKGIRGITVSPMFYDLIYIYRNSGDIFRRYVDMAKFDEERGIAYLDMDYNLKPEIRKRK